MRTDISRNVLVLWHTAHQYTGYDSGPGTDLKDVQDSVDPILLLNCLERRIDHEVRVL